ncbi:hypothetical protein GCM10009639_07840 [Kitasatospora putterlickiae]|uniref:Peptidase inhibitor family I36 n=1 Tax=Kitasatospora putterlickiae TaxID=221725 RepID=A0ABP4IE88_9ACTN
MLRSRPKRSALGVAGALTAVLTAFAGTGPAQAAPAPATPPSTGQVLIAPPAPPLQAQAQAAAIAAVSPTISPAAPFDHVPADSDYRCDPGNLCTLVWDPTAGDYKIFFLSGCARYSLSGWFGQGFYADNQTGGVRSYFYGANGAVLKSFTPDGGANHTQDWTPVWSIRNC